MQRAFPENGRSIPARLCSVPYVVQIKKGFNEAEIYVLDWPENSPNLNPIENLWSNLKSRLQKIDCTTKTKLIKTVIQLWYNDPEIEENCKMLV